LARVIPSDYDIKKTGVTTHFPELRTLDRLRQGLSDQYVIYHGVHWAKAKESASVYGEIDFIVLSPYGQLLAIEQKDGHVVIDGDDLLARYKPRGNNQGQEERLKSVTTQVGRNLHALRNTFSKRFPNCKFDIDYLLYLPAATIQGKLPSSIDPKRLIDAKRDHQLIETVESLLAGPPKSWSDNRLNDLPIIDQFLSQRFGVAPHIGVLGRTARDFTTIISGGLTAWTLRLSMLPWRLRVQGTAGSGKTQLALHLLRDAAAAGRSALYVCFNRPLADAMKSISPSEVHVVTFHELARTLAVETNQLPEDFSADGVFESLAKLFVEVSPKLAGQFDTLIVDEGQDFEKEWSEGLLRLAKENGQVLWLEDSEQALYQRTQVDLSRWVTIKSPTNYRTSKLIVEFINWLKLTDEPIEAASPVIGFDPTLYIYYDDESPAKQTESAVLQLIQAGYSPSNIAVLSFRGIANSKLAGKGGPVSLAGFNVRKQLGYDANGNTVWSQGNLLVDSIYRFKGQAADAVVITEVDFESLDARSKRLLFVGLSRARLQVIIVTSLKTSEILLKNLSTVP